MKERFEQLKIWKSGDERAPHKPLLILLALSHCARGEGRLIPYAEVDRKLKKLLIDFGPPRKSRTEYPFWRLQKDEIWELQGTEQVKENKSGDVRKRDLLQYNVQGGFTEEIYSKLSHDPKLLAEIAHDLLDAHFPESIHEDILQAVGLDLNVQAIRVQRIKVRDPHFREHILQAYEYQCAVCGFNVRLGDTPIALEAAHIKWHQAGGPDEEHNGIALCSLHHKLFDRGAFTLYQARIIQVSERAHGTNGFEEWLKAFHGQLLRTPQRPSYFPKIEFVEWHVKEVFQGPSRYPMNEDSE